MLGKTRHFHLPFVLLIYLNHGGNTPVLPFLGELEVSESADDAQHLKFLLMSDRYPLLRTENLVETTLHFWSFNRDGEEDGGGCGGGGRRKARRA